jgi:cytochrome c oxidase subunit 2
VNPALITTTEAVDRVFFYIFGISVVLLLAITATMVWFVVKYHRTRQPQPQPSPRYNLLLETAWTVIPSLIVLTMFWYGWQGYTTLSDVPEGAMEVKVSGRKWSWSFIYPNGRTSDILVVSVGKPVFLNITSEDVLHSFFVPAFRIKRDAVPGMRTSAWFVATEAGSYHAFCAEYCGTGHATMITTVEAKPEEAFEEWYREEDETDESETEEARQLLAQNGCIGCHSLDGSKKVGPTLLGIFGREVAVTTDGVARQVTVDRDYLERSIVKPEADLVDGYPAVMPAYPNLSADELEDLVEYLEQLR